MAKMQVVFLPHLANNPGLCFIVITLNNFTLSK